MFNANILYTVSSVHLYTQVTGRILVLPPNAVMYLLHLNKKWKDNKASMEDYFDFNKLRTHRGLQTMQMQDFLETVAKKGLLDLPLPNNDAELTKQPLWEYLEKACYQRAWSPGKLFIGFNITMLTEDGIENNDNYGSNTGHATKSKQKSGDIASKSKSKITAKESDKFIGDFAYTEHSRLEEFSMKGIVK